MLILLHHLLLSSVHLLLLLLSVLLLLLVGLLLLVLLLSQLLLLLCVSLLLVLLLLTRPTVVRGAGVRLLLARPSHLLVVGLVLGENLLPHLLSALVNIRIELVAVLFDGEFLVVVDRYVNLLSANWFFVRVVELSDVGMLQSLLSGQSFTRVELQK